MPDDGDDTQSILESPVEEWSTPVTVEASRRDQTFSDVRRDSDGSDSVEAASIHFSMTDQTSSTESVSAEGQKSKGQQASQEEASFASQLQPQVRIPLQFENTSDLRAPVFRNLVEGESLSPSQVDPQSRVPVENKTPPVGNAFDLRAPLPRNVVAGERQSPSKIDPQSRAPVEHEIFYRSTDLRVPLPWKLVESKV